MSGLGHIVGLTLTTQICKPRKKNNNACLSWGYSRCTLTVKTFIAKMENKETRGKQNEYKIKQKITKKNEHFKKNI